MTTTQRVRCADGPVVAQVSVPPSKSIANRALLCAALADGPTEIIGIAPGDDTAAMIDCLQRLGTGIALDESDGTVVASIICVVARVSRMRHWTGLVSWNSSTRTSS